MRKQNPTFAPLVTANLATTTKLSAAVSKLIKDATAPTAKSGSRVYYLQRLERDHPAIAQRVKTGEISCYRGCLEAGIRKPVGKATRWTRVDAYLVPEKATM